MLGPQKTFLAIDFGAANLKVAEFDVNEAGVIRLLRYAIHPMSRAGMQDATRKGAVSKGLQEIVGSKVFAAKAVNACLPGYQIFHKFIKLPAVDPAKVPQVIQFEAQQNIPFPLDVVVWDYQILAALPSGELEVLLVAVKKEFVQELFEAINSVGLRLEVVDAPPAALANAFRYNYPEINECTMLIDIGARTSSVLFFDGDRYFCRSINIGSSNITQDFALEAKLPYAQAEKLKIEEGFVGLGGAYEEPESPHQAAISKIARQVMTRLHIQINQTIQFYRTQQGGREPKRVFLSGGGATMPYTLQFFQEKLGMPVEFFNPFRNIDIGPSIEVEQLARVAHTMGEVVGVALRSPARCPVEVNLIPAEIKSKQQFNQKKPYLAVSFAGVVLVIVLLGLFFQKVAQVQRMAYEDRRPLLEMLQQRERQFKTAMASRDEAKKMLDQYTQWLEERFYWGDLIAELRNALVRTEATLAKAGIRPNVWIEIMAPKQMEEQISLIQPHERDTHSLPPLDPELARRYGLLPPTPEGETAEGLTPEEMAALGMTGGVSTQKEDTNTVSEVTLTCRAVSWADVFEAADSQLAYTLLQQLQQSPFFATGGTNGTQLVGQMQRDPTTRTFTFQVRLKLARPIKL